MFYKVIYNDKVIDALDNLVYLKYKPKHNRMVLCKEHEAQATISSDGKRIWHVYGWYEVPVEGYDTVAIKEIDEYEYKRLKALECGTKEDIIDEFTRLLIAGDSSLLLDSLERLYLRQEIDEIAVTRLCEQYDVAEDDKLNILKCSF